MIQQIKIGNPNKETEDRYGVKYKYNSEDDTEKLFEEIRLGNSRMDKIKD